MGVHGSGWHPGMLDISFTAPATALRNVTRSARVERLPDESFTCWTKRQLRTDDGGPEDEKRRKYRGAFRAPLRRSCSRRADFQESAETWLKRLSVFARGKLASAFDLSVALVRARAASLL